MTVTIDGYKAGTAKRSVRTTTRWAGYFGPGHSLVKGARSRPRRADSRGGRRQRNDGAALCPTRPFRRDDPVRLGSRQHVASRATAVFPPRRGPRNDLYLSALQTTPDLLLHVRTERTRADAAGDSRRVNVWSPICALRRATIEHHMRISTFVPRMARRCSLCSPPRAAPRVVGLYGVVAFTRRTDA